MSCLGQWHHLYFDKRGLTIIINSEIGSDFCSYNKEIIMDRRSFLKVGSGSLALGAVGAVGVVGASSSASALINYNPSDYQGINIDNRLTFINARDQRNTQWCWASCISMVFLYYGLNVSQETIVEQIWGGLVDNTGTPHQILTKLNHPWLDPIGHRFYVTGDSYSANHKMAAHDLSNDMPLIIGTMGHTMVLTSLVYVQGEYGRGEVIDAIVYDPWEDRGRRSLSEQEWYSADFLTRMMVQG